MSSTYTGDRTATQAPSPAPGADVSPKLVLPAGLDFRNAASVEQAFKTTADYIDWLTHTAEMRDYAPGMRFRENWLGFANIAGPIQPNGMATNWRSVSTASTAGGVKSGLVGNDSQSPCMLILPGTQSGDNVWLVTATVNGAGPAVLADTGGLFRAGGSGTGCRARVQWAGALEDAVGNTTTFLMGCSDVAETDRAFKNNDATGKFAGFQKQSAQTKWNCVTAGGGAATTTSAVGPVVADGVRNLFAIEIDTTIGTPEVRFYIDDVLVATHTANLPGVGQRLAFGGIRTSTAAQTYLRVFPVYAYADVVDV
jgi:hypothetical protein